MNAIPTFIVSKYKTLYYTYFILNSEFAINSWRMYWKFLGQLFRENSLADTAGGCFDEKLATYSNELILV